MTSIARRTESDSGAGSAIESWMRSKGKLGGQHKVPRMDGAGALTSELVGFLHERGLVAGRLEPAATV